MRVTVGLFLVVIGAVACSGDPATPEYWEKQIHEAHRAQERARIWDDLRASTSLNASFADMLDHELSAEKKPEASAALVRVIAKVKSPKSVGALVDAVDWSANTSEGNALNREIASALGQIGSPDVVAPLMRLLKAKNGYVQVEAAQALGRIHAKDAGESLMALVENEQVDPFVTKVAIEALGDIGEARAVPELVKEMFKGRHYDESAFALYQIGKPASDALLSVLKGDDKALSAWAREHNVVEPALYAKTAEVLGDLHETRAESVLLSRLTYKTGTPALELIVQMKAAEALGQLRSKESVKGISTHLSEDDPNARDEFTWALARIGSRDSLPALLKSAATGPWAARAHSLDTIGLIGDDHEKAALEKLVQEEPARTAQNCSQGDEDPGCGQPAQLAPKHVAYIRDQIKRLELAAECKQDSACWLKKLEDPSATIRERAALELGRSGGAPAVDALVKHLSDADVLARGSVIQALDWLTDTDRSAQQKVSGARESILAQLDKEHSSSDYSEVNKYLRRLIAKVSRS